MDRKRIQRWSNASQHIPIYLQPFFLKYSDISVASDWFSTVSWSEWAFFLPHFAFPWVRPWDNRGKCHTVGKRIQCSLRRNFAKILIYTKLEWMGYRVLKKAWQYVQPFWYNTSVWQTERRTDVQPIAKTYFSIADARKKINTRKACTLTKTCNYVTTKNWPKSRRPK